MAKILQSQPLVIRRSLRSPRRLKITMIWAIHSRANTRKLPERGSKTSPSNSAAPMLRAVSPLALKSQTWSCQSANQRSRPLARSRSKWPARPPQSNPIIIVVCMTICRTHPNFSAPWTARQMMPSTTAARPSISNSSPTASSRRNRGALPSARTLVAEASTRSKSGLGQKEPTRILTTMEPLPS